jgi:two-component system LytT family sensor kinase
LLAGALQFLGVILNALRNFSLIPTTFVTTYGSQIGSTLFTLLVSIALMARFDRLRREKEHAQSEALRSHQSASEAKRVTAELRLEALQAKINPHFLFNTLNTIAGLIAESPSRAQGVVVRLSRLFRFTLTATTKDRVLLTEELAIVRSYLEIEQERFGDRLRFDITVNGEIENISLPGLTIQPLVENSVKHGLRSKVEGGRVEVWVRVESENVLITVADDGVGMDTTISTNGHGLHSVRERLRLVYGKAASMTLTSPPGLRIDIRLPARS